MIKPLKYLTKKIKIKWRMMIINMETISRIKEDIKSNIELATILHKERFYEEFAKNNIFLQKEILLNSIAYAKIKEGTNSPQEIHNNYEKESDSEIHISDDVPNALMLELFEYIPVVLEKQKEYFHIDSSQNGRYNLLFKGVLHYIKLLKLNLQDKNIVAPSAIEDIIKPMNLKNAVDLYFDKMIDCAIVFCKCYEADSRNNKMCLEALDKEFTQYYKYQYKLDPDIEQQLKKDITLIANNVVNKDEYSKEIDFNESKIHLADTLLLAKSDIDNIIDKHEILKSKDYSSLVQIYRQIFKNSKDRFRSSSKTTQFIKELKKSHMYHRMPYKNKIIYPFLYDLLLMSFNYAIFHIQHKEVNTDINKLMKVVNATKYLYLEKDSDENYHFNEFTRAAEEIPLEYKTLDDPTILILKHYSEFLGCNYESIANVLRQLRFETTGHYGNTYKLLQDQRNIDLNFDDDYFRKLSLYII